MVCLAFAGGVRSGILNIKTLLVFWIRTTDLDSIESINRLASAGSSGDGIDDGLTRWKSKVDLVTAGQSLLQVPEFLICFTKCFNPFA